MFRNAVMPQCAHKHFNNGYGVPTRSALSVTSTAPLQLRHAACGVILVLYAFAFGVGRVSGAATDSSGCRGAGDETRRNGGEGGDRERERACARAAEMNPAVRMRGPPGRCNQRVTSQQVRDPRQHKRAMHTHTHTLSLSWRHDTFRRVKASRVQR